MNFRVAVLLAVAIGVPRWAEAASITFDFQTQFSNSIQPGGPAPWVTATFDDATAQAGYDVRATFNINGLTGTEFISELFFNINPTINAFQVTSIPVSGTNAALETVAFGTNLFSAAGSGLYDMRVAFNTSNAPNAARATDGNIYVIDINWTQGMLTATDFNQAAFQGLFFAAGHLQAIGGSGSTWIADNTSATGDCVGCTPNPTIGDGMVPEPASMVLLGSGLAVLVARMRKRQQRA